MSRPVSPHGGRGDAEGLPALLSALADLSGRALEINSRMMRDAQSLAEIHQRMVLVLSRIALAGTTAPLSPPPPPAVPPGKRLLRINEVCRRVGLSRSTIWRLAKDGEFPALRRLGPHAVAWLESEIEEWIMARGVARETTTMTPPPAKKR